jgi:uroporphyrinogen decarboxylase
MIMTPRRRVLAALNHQEGDRVPICCGSSGSGITDGVAENIKKELEITGSVAPFRRGHGDTIYDPRIMEVLGSDFRHVMLYDPVVLRGEDQREEDGSFKNEWGILVRKSELYYDWYGHPLEHATLADLDSYPWPDPTREESSYTGNIGNVASQYAAEGYYALSARSPSRGVFELAIQLRGFEKFLMDMAVDPTFALRLVEKIGDSLISYYDVLLSVVGEYVDIVEMQDDLAHQQALFMSLDFFRKFLKPTKHRLNQLIRQKAPKAWIYHHSCGAVEPLIPELMDIGVQILNPVQPLARGMDPEGLKKNYGDELVFFGGIDLQQALSGPPERVDREVRLRLKQVAPGGGYILAPSNVIREDVPTENVILLYKLAARYGEYPLDFRCEDLDGKDEHYVR